MKLSAYVVLYDGGFAPNPFHGICTLACCRPTIRRNAEPGDIVVGTGSTEAGMTNHLVYAMRVGKVLGFDDYWVGYPSKRYSPRTPVTQCGDNIWHHNSKGHWVVTPDAVHDEDALDRDTGGQNVLVASEFYYFGGDAILIPTEFQAIAKVGPGHKNTRDLDLISRFWSWIESVAPKRGRIGMPTLFERRECQHIGECVSRTV